MVRVETEYIGTLNKITVSTLLGAIIIAVGHMRNYALGRRAECDH